MTDREPCSISQLLHDASDGDTVARNRLWSATYDELRQLAKAQLAKEGPGCTLQTSLLVNEAYLRLAGNEPVSWANRRHFFGAAAQAMRRIIVDAARNRRRIKRGGGQMPEALLNDPAVFDRDLAELLAVDEALGGLERADPRRAEVVALRYFAELSIGETAQALGVSSRTVDTEWRFARAWLHRELSKGNTRTQRNAEQ